MTPTNRNLLHKNPLSHRDTQFINVIYLAPIGMLAQLDKEVLCQSLDKAKKVCQWLEGILALHERHGKGE